MVRPEGKPAGVATRVRSLHARVRRWTGEVARVSMRVCCGARVRPVRGGGGAPEAVGRAGPRRPAIFGGSAGGCRFKAGEIALLGRPARRCQFGFSFKNLSPPLCSLYAAESYTLASGDRAARGLVPTHPHLEFYHHNCHAGVSHALDKRPLRSKVITLY